MKQSTLCFLDNGDKILLAMKKRGFGVGKWNGVGGKYDKEKGDKNIVDTAIRETKEEIGVLADNLEKVAVLNFDFPYKKEWNQSVHVFLAKSWLGDVSESEEMLPRWFKKNDLPYKEMWDDDKYWLHHVFSGKKMLANFVFKEKEIIDRHDIKFVEEV